MCFTNITDFILPSSGPMVVLESVICSETVNMLLSAGEDAVLRLSKVGLVSVQVVPAGHKEMFSNLRSSIGVIEGLEQ